MRFSDVPGLGEEELQDTLHLKFEASLQQVKDGLVWREYSSLCCTGFWSLLEGCQVSKNIVYVRKK